MLFGHLDVWPLPGSFFSLMTIMILAIVMAAPIHSFNNFHYPCQLFWGSQHLLSELCVFVSWSLNGDLHEYVSLGLLLIFLEQVLHTAYAFWTSLWQNDSDNAAVNNLPVASEWKRDKSQLSALHFAGQGTHTKHTERWEKKKMFLGVLSVADPSCSLGYSTQRDSLYRTGFSCILLYGFVHF